MLCGVFIQIITCAVGQGAGVTVAIVELVCEALVYTFLFVLVGTLLQVSFMLKDVHLPNIYNIIMCILPHSPTPPPSHFLYICPLL